mmetsp:Transcript_13517/g.23991  ORF Transcript_13517/g.23991 Transcript_13517/m.23991 type:complete len:476 (-) Transcript_13517:491-1918(-)
MHVVDDVHGVNVHLDEPVEAELQALHHLEVVERCGGVLKRRKARPHLRAAHLVAALVQDVQQQLGHVAAGAKKLHVLPLAHRGDAAGDGVVRPKHLTHHQVVLVLNGAGLNRHLGGKLLEGLGEQVGVPQDGDVGLGGGSEIVEGLQDAVGGLGDAVALGEGVGAAQDTGDPGGVAGKEVVVVGGAQVLHDAQLHYEVVNHLLRLLLRDPPLRQVLLEVNVQEGVHAAHAHGRTVLLLHRSQVAEVQPLHRLLSRLGGAANVAAIGGSHLLEILQSAHLVRHLLAQLDRLLVHHRLQVHVQVVLLVGHQRVGAIERHATVVTDDTTTTVAVGQTGEDATLAARAHVRRVSIEHALVVRLANLRKLTSHLLVLGQVVGLERIVDHADATKRLNGALEGLVGLQTHADVVELGLNVARGEGGDGGGDVGVAVEKTSFPELLHLQVLHNIPQLLGLLRGARQKAGIAIIRREILLDEL